MLLFIPLKLSLAELFFLQMHSVPSLYCTVQHITPYSYATIHIVPGVEQGFSLRQLFAAAARAHVSTQYG
jgi:hypothetical protein